MPLGRALESASVSLMLNKLATQQVLDFFLKWKLDGALLTKLKMKLTVINAVLNHAEEKQVNDQDVKAWLEEVRVAAYDAEDILDEISTDALESHYSTKKVRNSIYDYCSASEKAKEAVDFKMNDIANALNPFKERIESKMRKIIERLEDLEKQKDILRLREDAIGTSSGIIDRLPTTPMVIESCVYGRDKNKEEIIKLLMLGEENDDGVSVIPIVGMGGVGKTTLAQLVYNDENVGRHFNLKSWACVSDVFDGMKITKALVESASKKTHSTNNLELLQENLKILLNKGKFLLVLDDVWNEKCENWDLLKKPFTFGAPGSKIIVTTRNEDVARITVPIYHLQELSKDDCWSLFEQIVFPKRNSDDYPKLKVIGADIVQKCKGLPLAAKVLGNLLRIKLNENHWEDILYSKLWDLPDDNILPALRLSYYHLPAHLKRCFAYCSMFPKDFEFQMVTLVHLWMAEGFVQQPEGNKRMEDVGANYFSYLLARSFFQQSNGEEPRFMMHDLIHDLAQCVSGKTCIRLEDNMGTAQHYNVTQKTRHFSYIRGFNDVFQKFEPLRTAESLRTFLPINPSHGFNLSSLTNKVPHGLLPNLRFLRVLSLSGYLIAKLPNSLGDLKHLRYLDLSHSHIEELPETTSSLYNLQTLILFECRSLTMLPTDIGSLTNLRHLNTEGTRLKMMPLRIGRLINLQTLSNFVAGKDSGSGIGELKDLLHLQGRLSISGLHNVGNVRDAIKAKLEVKQHLDELVLEWSSSTYGLQNQRVEENVLDALQPHQNLKMLTIRYYGGTEFPSWMGDPSFTNMVYLHLYGCIKCTVLPSLGQLPSLKDLILEGFDAIKHVGLEFYGDGDSSVNHFPLLETLKFENMKEWEEWSSCGDGKVDVFPCLRELSISRCPKLKIFSQRFASLEKLRIRNCAALTAFSGPPAPEEFPCLRRLVLVWKDLR